MLALWDERIFPLSVGGAMTEKLRQFQKNRVLGLLESKEWVSVALILDLRVASYTRRLTDLKREGYIIERREKRVGRQRYSEYRLLGKLTDQSKVEERLCV